MAASKKRRNKSSNLKRHPSLRYLRLLLGLLVIILLPFIALIRGAVHLHLSYSINPWLALVLGSAMMFTVLVIYALLILSRHKSGFAHSNKAALVLGLAVLCFAGYSTFFVSSENVKHPEIKSTYSKLHPLLRVAVGTFVFIDDDLVVTDSLRERTDYKKWRLSPRTHSHHYEQKDGYVHAVDIRTIGRSEFVNRSAQLFFYLMGFDTLRHVGTGDHLHISLPNIP